MVADKTVFEWEGDVEPMNLAKTGDGSRVFAAVRLEMPET
jgi:hypothetical protein